MGIYTASGTTHRLRGSTSTAAIGNAGDLAFKIRIRADDILDMADFENRVLLEVGDMAGTERFQVQIYRENAPTPDAITIYVNNTSADATCTFDVTEISDGDWVIIYGEVGATEGTRVFVEDDGGTALGTNTQADWSTSIGASGSGNGIVSVGQGVDGGITDAFEGQYDGVAVFSGNLADADRHDEPIDTDTDIEGYWPFPASGTTASDQVASQTLTITGGAFSAGGSWDEPASGFGESVTDGVEVGDSVTAVLGFSPGVTDGVQVGDSVSAAGAFSGAVTDGVTVGDSVQGGLSFSASVVDGVVLGEDLDTVLTSDSGPDGVLVGDSVVVSISYVASVVDGVRVGDGATGVLGSSVRSVADQVLVGDSVSVAADFSAAVVDGAVVGDSVTAVPAYSAAVTDGVVAGDSVAASLDGARSVSDRVLTGDLASALQAYTAAVADGVVLGDGVIGVPAFASSLTGGVVVGDSITVTSGFVVPAIRNTLGRDGTRRYLRRD